MTQCPCYISILNLSQQRHLFSTTTVALLFIDVILKSVDKRSLQT